jgi:hypothetical protein
MGVRRMYLVYMPHDVSIGDHWIAGSLRTAMAKMPTVTLPTSSLSSVTTEWDPITNSDKEVASNLCLVRIKRWDI